MRLTLTLAMIAGAFAMTAPAPAHAQTLAKPQWTLVIHGGAGVLERENMTPEREKAARDGLDRALAAGEDILAKRGSALDAVQAAVTVLEEDPNFNAGRGASRLSLCPCPMTARRCWLSAPTSRLLCA